jgi:hypothetical protein
MFQWSVEILHFFFVLWSRCVVLHCLANSGHTKEPGSECSVECCRATGSGAKKSQALQGSSRWKGDKRRQEMWRHVKTFKTPKRDSTVQYGATDTEILLWTCRVGYLFWTDSKIPWKIVQKRSGALRGRLLLVNDAKDMPKVSTEHPALIQSLCWCGEDNSQTTCASR